MRLSLHGLTHRLGRALVCVLLSTCVQTAATAAEISKDLIDAAKKEGTVTWYTTLIVDQIVRPIGAAFEKKYGIKMLFSRGDGPETVLKILNEGKAQRTMADVYGIATGLDALQKAGAVESYDPVNGADLPADYKDPAHTWIASNVYIITPGMNTNLVPAAEAPQSYEDLLLPKWKGKLVWKPNDISGAHGFIGNILTSRGEDKGMDYLRRLSRQNIVQVNASARAVLDQVITGEYPIALQIYNNHAEISRQKGAPVTWIAMEPVTVSLNIIGLVKNAPHPNAARLLIEFILSKEGQEVFRAANYYPVRPDVPALNPALLPATGHFQGHVVSPDMISKGLDHWIAVYNDLFR